MVFCVTGNYVQSARCRFSWKFMALIDTQHQADVSMLKIDLPITGGMIFNDKQVLYVKSQLRKAQSVKRLIFHLNRFFFKSACGFNNSLMLNANFHLIVSRVAGSMLARSSSVRMICRFESKPSPNVHYICLC